MTPDPDRIKLPEGTVQAVAVAIAEALTEHGMELAARVSSVAEVAAASDPVNRRDAGHAIARAAIRETLTGLLAAGYVCRSPGALKGGL